MFCFVLFCLGVGPLIGYRGPCRNSLPAHREMGSGTQVEEFPPSFLRVRSWAALGCYVGGLGPLLGHMWPKNAKNAATLKTYLFPKQECDLRPPGRSWAALGACVGGLGPLLGPLLLVLGHTFAVLARSWGLGSRSWGVCWRSLVALGASVGGPGPSWADKWLKPWREDDLGRMLAPLAAREPRSSLCVLSYRLCVCVCVCELPAARSGSPHICVSTRLHVSLKFSRFCTCMCTPLSWF